MTNLLITAIVCTHNRAEFLQGALTSLAVQTLEATHYEVLVVDNASNDNTVEIVELWKSKILNCRYVYEEKLGLSYARNRGLKDAYAPVVAYLDDDAVAEPQWLSALLAVYSSIHPIPAAVGGKILLQWHGVKPVWLNHVELLQMLGLKDDGEKIKPVRHISGGNMSFNKSVLLTYGGFDPRLGRRGNLQLTAEESEIQLRMRADGQILYYQPGALVWHQIDKTKQTPSYLVHRYYSHGQSDALRYALYEKPNRYTILKLMIREFVRKSSIVVQFYKIFWLGQRPPSAKRYWLRCQLAQLLGFEKQMFIMLLSIDEQTRNFCL